MGFKKGQNPNHPRKGAAIKVDPIRDLQAVVRIRENLKRAHEYRNYCLFTLGVNTAWRANELLSIRVGDVEHLKDYEMLTLKQSKTNTYRATPLNPLAIRALRIWLEAYQKRHPIYYHPGAPLFPSMNHLRSPLSVPSITALVKKWCKQAGVSGHFGSHTMRKTWGYRQRVTYNAQLSLICRALEHSSERETLAYIGILPEEVNDLYRNEI